MINPDLEHIAQWEIKYSLEQLAGLFAQGVRLTLVVRDPRRVGSVMIYGDDQALREILEMYFERAKGINNE